MGISINFSWLRLVRQLFKASESRGTGDSDELHVFSAEEMQEVKGESAERPYSSSA